MAYVKKSMVLNFPIPLLVFIITLFLPSVLIADNIAQLQKPEVLLAQIYQPGTDVTQYMVSEKFDGIRAIWNGKVLRSRAGNVINAPLWFTRNFPDVPMDGELWMGYGRFEILSGVVHKHTPIDKEWQSVSYLVFEMPGATGPFVARSQTLSKIVEQARLPHLKAVKQMRIKDEAAMQALLSIIVSKGGEGLMLHRADAPYITGRSEVLLKLKPLYDAEATVVAHTPGRGKYAGKLGALIVETPEGLRFKIGTGFSDEQRANPPKAGSLITYTYRGFTKTGKPRFASFLRMRTD
jgi:DNA ligase 1